MRRDVLLLPPQRWINNKTQLAGESILDFIPHVQIIRNRCKFRPLSDLYRRICNMMREIQSLVSGKVLFCLDVFVVRCGVDWMHIMPINVHAVAVDAEAPFLSLTSQLMPNFVTSQGESETIHKQNFWCDETQTKDFIGASRTKLLCVDFVQCGTLERFCVALNFWFDQGHTSWSKCLSIWWPR